MRDQSDEMILRALHRAAATPIGLPLTGSRSTQGLFDNTKTAKAAAQQALELGLIQSLRTESNGKPNTELYAITKSGLSHLLDHTDPARILVALVRAVEVNGLQITELAGGVRKTQVNFQGLKEIVETVLTRIGGASETKSCRESLLEHLSRWQIDRPAEDCPLPELGRLARQTHPGMSLGQFHDSLRTLHEERCIYLHPWTGPLYDLPEPAYALLSGHEIVYYASLRGTIPEITSQRSDFRTAVTHARF